ncbi:MAG TPA: hypothetical protein VGM82_03980 [Gemmatimonadaceae bacterium]|jgi:hypothetical protein
MDRLQEPPLDDRKKTMHLVGCQTPQGPLEDAPLSALLAADVDQGDCWEAFWSSDTYLVRCTRANGSAEWFMVSDEEAPADPMVKASERRQRATATRVLEFPLRRMQTRVVIAKGPDGRDMMVGTTRRFNRKIVRRGGE